MGGFGPIWEGQWKIRFPDFKNRSEGALLCWSDSFTITKAVIDFTLHYCACRALRGRSSEISARGFTMEAINILGTCLPFRAPEKLMRKRDFVLALD